MEPSDVVLAVLAASTLGACGAIEMRFDKPGTSSEQQQQDSNTCLFQVKSTEAAAKYAKTSSQLADLMTLCMQGKGYTRVQ